MRESLSRSNFQVGNVRVRKQVVIASIMVIALMAFEMFNFDTTQFALKSLLGDVRFLGIGWAAILAVAFCAIDFAGLVRLFTPEQGSNEPKEVWYLTGAWLLGATMNAIMTWWAISLTLLDHPLGNEVMSREELLKAVPVFVAILVWLTRILFIGSLSVAGERLLYGHGDHPGLIRSQGQATQPTITTRATPVNKQRAAPRTTPRATPRTAQPTRSTTTNSPPTRSTTNRSNGPAARSNGTSRPKTTPRRRPTTTNRGPNSRVRQRPPMPRSAQGGGGNGKPAGFNTRPTRPNSRYDS